jgi:MATE family multidrug resistance protein
MLKDELGNIKKTFLIAYPIMLSQLGQVSVGVVDTIMVGRIGREPLAGASLGNSVFMLFLAFGIGISYGITPLVAQADGAGNPRRITELLKHGILVNTLTSLVLFGMLLPLTFSLGHLNQPENVVKLASPFLFIIALSIIPFMIFQAFRQFTEGLSFTRQSMTITIIGNVINIILNYILINGKFGFPALGLTGSGIATLIARCYMAMAMGGFVFFSRKFRVYREHFLSVKIDRVLIKKILSIGLPSGLQFVFELGAFSMAAIMMGWLGTVSLAAHQIAINLASLTYMMASGIAAATTIRVGNQFGKRDITMMRKAGYTGFIMSASFMGFNAVLLILGRHFLPSLYINDPEVVKMASMLIMVAAFFQISDGVQVVGLGALRGMSDVRVPTLYTLFSYWALALPIGLIAGIWFHLGPIAIWLGLWAGLTCTAILLFLRFKKISSGKTAFS